MTIREVRDMLSKEIERGNGEKEVGFIDYFETTLCPLTEGECGFYTEEWFTIRNGIKQKTGESTRYILGNYLRAINENDNDEERHNYYKN